MRPTHTPIGLHLSQAARIVHRAFERAMEEAGGSVPIWLVLLNLRTRQLSSQRELAAAVGVHEATLTGHLNAMEARRLVTRQRDPANRRLHLVELTEAGEAAFLRLREVAVAFDQRLRHGLTDSDLETLHGLLDRLVGNAGGADGDPPWAGLAEPVVPSRRVTRRKGTQ